jgi:ATP-dependent exoDNAse (exonuclease V) beta subunit
LQLRKQDRKVKWQDIAVIYRQHSHRVALVEEFGARQIPFVVVGTDLLNTAPLRDLVAILKALDSADDISLFRMALMLRFAIDLHWLRTALQQSHRRTPLSSLLEARADGRALLEALRRFQQRHDLRGMPMVTLLERVVSEWGLPQGEELNEFRRFVERWSSGPLRSNGDLSSFLQYFDYFQQAGGKLLASIPPAQNAVRLMTAHAAKGLEFQHVFVIRVISRSFPASYSEPLFEFPEELGATPKSLCDLKEQHGEEERRLFYVAMTRARDSLTLHGKRAKGKQKVPSVFLRELDENKQLRPFCTTRDAVRLLFDMEANAPSVTEQAAWLRLPPPAPDATAKLSVHAVETYSACPLRYKLQREWSLPSEPVAAMQFGAAIHRVIHEYFRALAAGRAYQEADLIEIFRAELSAARLADPLQQELYENQGVQQLRRFLQRSDLPTAAEVVGAEQRFSITVGDVEVIGRVDRIDRVGNRTATQVAIVDYKTGGPRSEEDAEKSLQLSVYALAAIHQWGFQPVRLAYHNLEDDTVVSTEFDTGRLRDAESKIEKAAAGIAAGVFEPKPSPFVCKRCEYRSLCPATEEKLYLIRTATSAAIH